MTAASAPPTMAARISERGARAAVDMVTKRHPCGELSTAPGSCPAPGNPALSGRRASNRASILRGMTSVTNRTFGAQSMTAPLREVLVKAPGPAFGRAFDDRGAAASCGRSTSIWRAASTTASFEALDGLGVARPRPGRRGRRRPGPRLRLRPAADRRRRRDPAPAGQAEPRGRARRARARGRVRRGHPDARPHRGAGHRRGRRHVLASPRPPVHRADAAHQRRRRPPARLDRRRRRPRVRRPVLEGTGRARPPALGHLAGRRRRRGRVPAAAARRAVRAPGRPRRAAGRGARGRSTRRSAATCWRSGRGSWSSRRATTARGAGSRRPAARCTRSRSARWARTAPAA